jgi:peptide/nickel transport system ATP-binding protein
MNSTAKELPLISVVNCTFAWDFDRSANFELRNINLDIQKGDLINIIGHSGSGKTTLGMLIAGLITPQSGRVYYEGRTKFRTRTVQIVFQNPYEAMNPRRSVRYWLDLARQGSAISALFDRTNHNVGDWPTREQLMKRLGLSDDLLDKFPAELSGGECQRMNLIANLLARPECLILDEPISMWDIKSRDVLAGLVPELIYKYHVAVILISHEPTTLSFPNAKQYDMQRGAVHSNDRV